MPIRTRFAPSPTGRLHLGHVLAARVAKNLARSEPRGEFLLRFEDIDTSRVRPAFYLGIEEDLQWLGLDWDGIPLRQTNRLEAHHTAFEQLHRLGIVYPCFCTRKDIQAEWARMGSAPQGPEGPLYPATCQRLSASEQHDKLASGLPYAWRLDTNHAAQLTGPLSFNDLRFGKIQVEPQLLGHIVLARKDIGISYHLAVVVDDAYQNITHVTRGDDLLPSTHVHRILQALLGFSEPTYLHHELVIDEHGHRLAKRSDSVAIATLREMGKSPSEVLAMISHLASS